MIIVERFHSGVDYLYRIRDELMATHGRSDLTSKITLAAVHLSAIMAGLPESIDED